MTTLWFSYSFAPDMTLDGDEPNRSPYHLTWHTGRFLRKQAAALGWDFRYINLDSAAPVTLGTDDVVVYHPWFTDGCFSQQILTQSCRAKFVLQPYTAQMVGPEALPTLHAMWEAADWLFLTTGPYWWDTMGETEYAPYQAKATRLDNIVNPALHPHLKRRWNPVGRRATLCIGYDNPVKGLDNVATLARVTGLKVLHLGSSDPALWQHVAQAQSESGRLFMPDAVQAIVDEVDFFITMGRYDANPTTLLETSCWGLLGLCTPQSGYWPGEPFIGLDLDDLAANWDTLDHLQRAPAAELRMQAAAQRRVVLERYRSAVRLDAMWDVMEPLLNAETVRA